jgi:hypothetical protein
MGVCLKNRNNNHKLITKGIKSPCGETGVHIRSSRFCVTTWCTQFRSRHRHQPLLHLQGRVPHSPCWASRLHHHGASPCICSPLCDPHRCSAAPSCQDSSSMMHKKQQLSPFRPVQSEWVSKILPPRRIRSRKLGPRFSPGVSEQVHTVFS